MLEWRVLHILPEINSPSYHIHSYTLAASSYLVIMILLVITNYSYCDTSMVVINC
jgi:hypothetical protein